MKTKAELIEAVHAALNEAWWKVPRRTRNRMVYQSRDCHRSDPSGWAHRRIWTAIEMLMPKPVVETVIGQRPGRIGRNAILSELRREIHQEMTRHDSANRWTPPINSYTQHNPTTDEGRKAETSGQT